MHKWIKKGIRVDCIMLSNFKFVFPLYANRKHKAFNALKSWRAYEYYRHK